jgi:hypothetical protein
MLPVPTFPVSEPGAASSGTDFLQDIIRVHKSSRDDISRRCVQCAMQGFAILVVKPVTWVQGQQIHLGPLGQVRRLVENQTTLQAGRPPGAIELYCDDRSWCSTTLQP